MFEVTNTLCKLLLELVTISNSMPLPGQYFCVSCMKPIASPRNEGKCDSCLSKEHNAMRGGIFCDHCGKNGARDLIYLNKKTKKRYCVDCRATFYKALIVKGMENETANKILIEDFILINDPTKRRKKANTSR